MTTLSDDVRKSIEANLPSMVGTELKRFIEQAEETKEDLDTMRFYDGNMPTLRNEQATQKARWLVLLQAAWAG